MTLSWECNNYQKFVCWKINGQPIRESSVILSSALIQNGKITAQLVTAPVSSEKGLLISEIYTGQDGPWIELYNASNESLHLDSYSLSNRFPSPLLKFNLPEYTLKPGEIFVAGVDNTGIFRLEQGNTVYLVHNNEIADLTVIPIMADTESYARLGETNEWRFYIHPTRGVVN